MINYLHCFYFVHVYNLAPYHAGFRLRYELIQLDFIIKVGCKADEGCFADPEKRFCSDNQCVGGCRETADCDGFDGICNVPGYDNCNYCVFEEMAEIGVCTPGTSWCQYPPILSKYA